MSETPCHVEFAQSARDDLRGILDWYASQGVSDAGTRVVLAIVARVRQLAMFPDSGKVVPELDTPWLRELEHPPFRIVHRRDETVVTVVRVWRSERLMDPGLARKAYEVGAADVPRAPLVKSGDVRQTAEIWGEDLGA